MGRQKAVDETGMKECYRFRGEKGDLREVKWDCEATLIRSQPSVKIKRDGKGGASYVVKVYADGAQDATDEALKISKRLDSELGIAGTREGKPELNE